MKKYLFEVRKFVIRSKAIYYTFHFSLSVVILLIFSLLLYSTGKELLVAVIAMLFSEIIFQSIVGWYKGAKETFMKNYDTDYPYSS